MSKSRARPVSVLFTVASPENQSVHFSFSPKEGSKPINMRIPASQLGPFINNLRSVQDLLESDGLNTNKDAILVPAPPYGFFQ